VLEALWKALVLPAPSRRLFMRGASKNKHDGYAPPWRPALTPPSWIDLRDQKFESGFLQQ
jgi:hypothetical protein